MKFLCLDCESDGLLDTVTKIHCLGINWGGDIRVTSDPALMKSLLERKDIYFVCHNIMGYDRPLFKKILGVDIPYDKCIDTLGLSWALYPKREAHGLASWGEDLGIEKPHIESWTDLTQVDYEHRVTEDVKIQSALWDKMVCDMSDLYSGGDWLPFARYVSFKMYTLEVQSRHPFKINITKCDANLAYLEGLKAEKVEALKRVMPPPTKKSVKTKPKVCFKADGTPSVHGQVWFDLLAERGLPPDYEGEVEVVHTLPKEPNPASHTQVKDWLLSLGWIPQTFKDGSNGKVPQVKNGEELCESVVRLADIRPEVKLLVDMGVLTHRIGLLRGFLRDQQGGYITQSAHGFTSTLRLRHRYLVNLPGVNKEFGEYIRSVLTCDDGYEICGSDLASLEDRTKQHYIYPLDPDYVKEMMVDGFDPHLSLSVFGGALTEEQAQAHKDKREDHSVVRHTWKQVNYMCTYQVGATKLASYIGCSKSEAKRLIDTYWSRNWAVKEVSKRWETKPCLGRTWIKNPVSGFWYELRSEKDRFSAVNQSTGSFVFDLWLKNILSQHESLTLQSHDEGGWIVKVGHRDKMEKILRDSIEKVNQSLKLNRDMGIDIKWGSDYGEVH